MQEGEINFTTTGWNIFILKWATFHKCSKYFIRPKVPYSETEELESTKGRDKR